MSEATRTLQDGTAITDHWFTLPLVHSTDDERTITVYAREYDLDGTGSKPWLLYLQGGPGASGTRSSSLSGWMAEAAKDYRILMLDQRGTGLSTPLNRQTIPALGSVEQQAEYLSHFRAPDIVADAEAIRLALGSAPWTTLGQSFGGFCTLTYLSQHPEGLKASMLTGGLGPVVDTAEDVYEATYGRMRARNHEFFSRYPEDWEKLHRVFERVRTGDVQLLDGSALTVGRVQTLGMYLGGNSRIDQLHFILQEAFVPGTEELTDTFLKAVYSQVSRLTNPLYAVLHESIYARPGAQPTRWAAQRVLDQHPDFNSDTAEVPLLTGEMVFDWYFDLDPALQPLAGVAHLLAEKSDWGPLYDLEQLGQNTIPVAAAVYSDDVYVDREISMRTAETVQGIQVWETADYHHDGLGADGAKIFRRLHHMVSPVSSTDN